MKPTYFKTIANHNIGSQCLTLETFMQMSMTDVLVTPTGSLCIMGDVEVIEEIVDMGEYEGTGSNVREFEFEDIGGTKRRIIFIDGYAAEYDIITIDGRIPHDTTGISYSETDDKDFCMFVDYDTGYSFDPYDFIGE